MYLKADVRLSTDDEGVGEDNGQRSLLIPLVIWVSARVDWRIMLQ